jgi:NAD(P)-dependent dehydrogenase (short-subunit alcohol dehydrogenase family)
MSIERFSLAGKVAIVTGGAGGCGEEYGRGLSAAGAQVVRADLDEFGPGSRRDRVCTTV